MIYEFNRKYKFVEYTYFIKKTAETVREAMYWWIDENFVYYQTFTENFHEAIAEIICEEANKHFTGKFVTSLTDAMEIINSWIISSHRRIEEFFMTDKFFSEHNAHIE